MKRLPIWFILGMLSVFFGAPVFAQDATLAIGNGAGTPGSTFTVPISMNNSVEVQGLQFIVTDERDVVDVESLTRSNRLTSRGFTLSSNSVSPTRTNVVLFKFGTTGLPSGTGTIVEVSFRVRDGVFNGTYPIKLKGVLLSDADANTISSGTVDGTITVTGGQERDLTPPEIPTNINATAGDRRIDLFWSSNTEEDLAYYIVYRSTFDGFSATPGDSITRINPRGNSYRDHNLTNNLSYYYRLSAVDKNGNRSAASSQVSGTPVDLTPPKAPFNPQTVDGDDQVVLRWEPNKEPDLSHYIVLRRLQIGAVPDSVWRVNAPGVQYTDASVINGTTYFYRVIAVDIRGNKSNPSVSRKAVPTATADTVPPIVPTGLTATGGDGIVRLKWSRNTENDLAGYIVFRKTGAAAADSISEAPHFANQYIDHNVTNGVNYTYELIAFDFSGNRSVVSNQASAMPDVIPTLKGIFPPIGPVTGGTQVLITGNNLKDGATVTIGGVSADSIKFLSSEQLSAHTPPGMRGYRNVIVTNPGGLVAAVPRGFLYTKTDSITVVVTVTSNVNGLTRTDTLHQATVPEGLPFITPPQINAPIGELQPLFNALAGMALEIPPGAATDHMTILLDIRNVTIRNDSTLFAPVQGKPSFFFVRPTVIINEVEQSNFTFSSLAALHMTLRLHAFGKIMQYSGVDTTANDTLTFAYATDSGLTQEGMISRNRFNERLMIASLTTLGDLAGVRRRDIKVNTAPPTFVSGPFARPGDTALLITWRTDKLSTGKVEYGTSENALNASVEDTNFVIGHAIKIGGLQKETRYFYRALTTDGAGQTAISRTRATKTITRPDGRPPIAIVAPQVLAVSRHGAVIGWTTDEQSNSTLEYGETTALGEITRAGAFVYRHIIGLTGLKQNTAHFVLVSSTDRSDNVTSFPDTLKFTTRNKTEDLPPRVLGRPVASSLTPNRAIIEWRTDELSNSRVFYRTVGDADTTQAGNPDEMLVHNHHVVLTGLKDGTAYRYAVRSTDVDGNTGGSRIHRFRTPETDDTTPPVIVRGPRILYRSNRVIAIGWVTNEVSNSFVYYRGGVDSTFIPRGTERQSRRHLVIIGGLEPETEYTFAVTSTDPSGNTVVFPEGTVLAKPLAPMAALEIMAITASTLTVTTTTTTDNTPPVITSGPDIVATSATSITLAWETDESSDSRVSYGPGLALWVSDDDLVTSHLVSITGLDAGTSYGFQVGSADPSGNGPAVGVVGTATTSSTPDTDPPVIIAGSVQTSASNDRITIFWETNEPGDSFIEYGTSSSSLDGMSDQADPVTSHSVTLANLTPDQTYFLRALSSDLAGNGPTATTTLAVTTTATADTVRPVISGVERTAVATSDTGVTLTATWTTDLLATRRIEYGATASLGSSITDSKTGTTHEMTIPILSLNTRYYFRIGAISTNDPQSERIAYTAIDSVVTPASADTTTPDTPANVTSIPGNGAVRLRWDVSSNSNVTGYTIQRNGATIATVGQVTSFLDESAANDQTHTYTIQAVTAVGNSSNGNTTQAAPGTAKVPTAPTVGAPSPGDTVSLAPTLIVNNAVPVPGDTSRATLRYAFQLSYESDFATLTASITGVTSGDPGNPTHWQVADMGRPGVTILEDGTTYWWRARADDGDFSGDWSAGGTFVASTSQPTGITLAAFSAASVRGKVTIDWRMGGGQKGPGFHVLRSLTATGGFERISTEIITADEEGYTYLDRDVRSNVKYHYMLESVTTGERFGPLAVRVDPPGQFSLNQNAPNPFNPTTSIRYELPNTVQVTLKVYNLLGQEVRLLVNARQEAGFHTIIWNGRNVAGRSVSSGVYFYRIEAGEFTKAKKMLLLK